MLGGVCGGYLRANSSVFATKELNSLHSSQTTTSLLLPKGSIHTGQGMFSSSVRRVASTAPSVPIAPSLSCAAPRTATVSYRSHQRRLSSSKPSSPADGSEGPPAARVSKKKAREVAANATVKGRDAALLHLPSVPSTQHIPEMRTFI